MGIHVEAVTGNAGYRHQLDRARRFFDRMNSTFDSTEFQDMAWAFFQNCWHMKDWLKHDPLASDQQKAQAINMAHNQSTALRICQDLCNGTKHLQLDRPKAGSGAAHHHVEYTMYVSAIEDTRSEIDCLVDDGNGQLVSGKKLAADCIHEWTRILESQGLATGRLS